MIKISIIIPVYNVEAYLGKCLESILEQYNSQIEIILVNDGSTDNSFLICNSYIAKYPFIKLISQQNNGLSDARNKGILLATGEYIWFIDSDDYIVKDSLATLINHLEYCGDEIIRFGFQLFEDGDEKNIEEYVYEHKNSMNTITYFNHNEFLIQAWAGIYRKDFLINNQLFFLPGLIYEDVHFNLQVYSFQSKMTILPLMLYMYRARKGSLLRSKIDKKKIESISAIIQLCDVLIIKNGIANSKLQIRKKYDYILLLMDMLSDIYDRKISKEIIRSLNTKVPVLNTDSKGIKFMKYFLSFSPLMFFSYLEKKK